MKNTLLLFVLLCLATIPYQGLAQMCGTIPTAEQNAYLESTRQARQDFDARLHLSTRNGSNYIWLPVQIHDGRFSDGSNGEFENNYFNLMIELNAEFQSQGIQFYECNFINNIDDDALYYFDYSEESLLNVHDVPNVINIYFFGNVTNGAATYCGYSYLPPSTDKILMSKGASCFNADVLIHEMGHYLSLYHTHGKTNATITDELVDGSNCAVAGDDVCDTPADPNLWQMVNGSCQYTGNAVDINNQPYQPDETNFMSYSTNACRTNFSTGQSNRILYSINNDRNYLNGCPHPSACDNPIVNFPYSQDFENGLDGWRNQESHYWEIIPFQVFSGSTPTPGTGPTSASSGSFYAYGEADDGVGSQPNMSLISPCIDISNLTSPQLSFDYHMTGSPYITMGVQLSTDGGYTWHTYGVFNQVDGDQGNQWHTSVLDLTPYKQHELLQIRIVGITVTADIAIDNIVIEDTNIPACMLTLVTSSTDVICNGDNNGSASYDIISGYTLPVTSAWSNGGTDPAIYNLSPGTYTVTVTDAQNCTAIHSFVISEPLGLSCQATATDATAGNSDGSASSSASGGVSPYSFLWSNGATTAAASNLAAGTYTVTITDANGCTQSCSATVNEAVVCSDTYSSFPYDYGFESNYGRFTQETVVDDRNWRRRSGSTPTNNTGPSSAFEGNKYAYLESSGGNNNPGKVSILKVKKCLDLTNLTNPVFEFAYHMYGSTMGSLEIEVSLDDEASWQTIWSESGNKGNQWFQASISLSAYNTDHTKLRIKGTTGSGNKSDMAIDDYYIGDAGGNNDLINSNDFMAETECKIFPNPSSGMFHIESGLDLNGVSVQVIDRLGRLVINSELRDQTLDLTRLDAGQYFIRIYTENQVINKKIIIAK